VEAKFGQAIVDFQIVEVKIRKEIITKVEIIKPAKWYKSRSSLSFHTLSSLLIKSLLRIFLKQGTKINNFKKLGSAEIAVPTMLLNVCEFSPHRRSLPSLLTGFRVAVAVRVPVA